MTVVDVTQDSLDWLHVAQTAGRLGIRYSTNRNLVQFLNEITRPAPDGEVVATYRHVKRGTTYAVIGKAELQMNADVVDGSEMVVYRGEDGRLWVREYGEFHDGRFEYVEQTHPPRNDAAVEALRALDKILPIRVEEGPDYAEVYFSDGSSHSTQAMTMNPQDWRDIAKALDALKQGKARP